MIVVLLIAVAMAGAAFGFFVIVAGWFAAAVMFSFAMPTGDQALGITITCAILSNVGVGALILYDEFRSR